MAFLPFGSLHNSQVLLPSKASISCFIAFCHFNLSGHFMASLYVLGSKNFVVELSNPSFSSFGSLRTWKRFLGDFSVALGIFPTLVLIKKVGIKRFIPVLFLCFPCTNFVCELSSSNSSCVRLFKFFLGRGKEPELESWFVESTICVLLDFCSTTDLPSSWSSRFQPISNRDN